MIALEIIFQGGCEHTSNALPCIFWSFSQNQMMKMITLLLPPYKIHTLSAGLSVYIIFYSLHCFVGCSTAQTLRQRYFEYFGMPCNVLLSMDAFE